MGIRGCDVRCKMKNYYYVDDIGEVQGPVTPQELESLDRSGRITSDTQVCEEGAESWQSYYQVAGGPPRKIKLPKLVQSVPQAEPKAINEAPYENVFQGVTRSQGTILIVLLLIGIGAPFWVFLQPTPTWEYQTVEILAETSGTAALIGENYEKIAYKTVPGFSAELDSMGSEGWELVSSFLEHETSHPNFGKEDYVTGLQPNMRPQKLVLIFKRPKKL